MEPRPLASSNIHSSCFHKKNDGVSLGNHLCFPGRSFDLVATLRSSALPATGFSV